MDQSASSQSQVLPPNPTPPVTPTPASPGQSTPQPPAKKGSGKKIILIVVGVLLLLLVGGGGYYFGTMKQPSASVTPTPALSPTITVEPTETTFKCEKSFFAYQAEKYPAPATKTIPTGLEDELFKSYEVDKRASGAARAEFKLKDYYGDVATGGIGRVGSSATWIMNEVNGQWKVIVAAAQELPRCEELQPYLNDLKEWQGSCYKSPGQPTDLKHPDEEYNQCK